MYNCSECEKAFLTKQALNAHKISHKEGKRYSVCRKSKKTELLKTFICKSCGAKNPVKKSTTNTFCNNKCQGEYRKRIWWEDNRPLFESGELKSRSSIKKFILERDGNCCAVCDQTSQHNGKKLTMILDHIDGNASNNIPENFRLLCPNCDSQQETYKARNIGKGRAARGMKWYSAL